MWKILQSTITGEQHQASHRDCQDRLRICQTDDILILAAADGHGGKAYCRSETGAQFACDSAVEVILDRPDWEAAAGRIKEAYDRKVDAHLQQHPLQEAEAALLEGMEDRIAYGTTLICAAITPEGIFRLQIGDGALHVVTASGSLLANLPADQDCSGAFTSSLVSANAAEKIRWDYTAKKIAAVAMYTDGYVPSSNPPWALLDLADNMPDQIPPEILAKGQRGDDQTVVVAAHTETTETASFVSGITLEKIRCSMEDQRRHNLQLMKNADATIRLYIQKLANCDSISIRNKLLERLQFHQNHFLSLYEIHQAIEQTLEDGKSPGKDLPMEVLDAEKEGEQVCCDEEDTALAPAE